MVQGGEESVASAWVLIIPILWPAPPHPPFIPKHSSGMGRRVGCLSLGIDLPPFYGPLLCFTDPPLSPLPNRAVCGACVGVMMMFGVGVTWSKG